jgi:hypothetical protein
MLLDEALPAVVEEVGERGVPVGAERDLVILAPYHHAYRNTCTNIPIPPPIILRPVPIRVNMLKREKSYKKYTGMRKPENASYREKEGRVKDKGWIK